MLVSLGVLCSLLLAIGLGVAGRVGDLRPAVRTVRRERLISLAAQSALEEVCARIEAGRALSASVDPIATAACYAADGLAPAPARLKYSDLRREPFPGAPRYGIVEIALSIRAADGREQREYTVVTRRYFEAKASRAGGWRIHPENLLQVVARS